MEIQTILFKREQDSESEKGVLIQNDGNSVIVDSNAKPIIDMVWDYHLTFDLVVNI